jgi:phosphatidylinositol glycan class Z
MAVLIGIYHQGGVIPAQIAMPQVVKSANTSEVTVFWWKTYPAPTYLIGAPTLDPDSNKPLNITGVSLMGLSEHSLKQTLLDSTYAADCAGKPPGSSPSSAVFLAAPLSAHLFDNQRADQAEHFSIGENEKPPSGGILFFKKEYVYHKHVNLDDLDFADDGVFGTLGRVLGRAGLGIWRVRRDCKES